MGIEPMLLVKQKTFSKCISKREIVSTRIWYIHREIGHLDLLYCIFTRTNISKLLLKNGYIQKEIFVVRQDTTKHEEHIRL